MMRRSRTRAPTWRSTSCVRPVERRDAAARYGTPARCLPFAVAGFLVSSGCFTWLPRSGLVSTFEVRIAPGAEPQAETNLFHPAFGEQVRLWQLGRAPGGLARGSATNHPVVSGGAPPNR